MDIGLSDNMGLNNRILNVSCNWDMLHFLLRVRNNRLVGVDLLPGFLMDNDLLSGFLMDNDLLMDFFGGRVVSLRIFISLFGNIYRQISLRKTVVPMGRSNGWSLVSFINGFFVRLDLRGILVVVLVLNSVGSCWRLNSTSRIVKVVGRFNWFGMSEISVSITRGGN